MKTGHNYFNFWPLLFKMLMFFGTQLLERFVHRIEGSASLYKICDYFAFIRNTFSKSIMFDAEQEFFSSICFEMGLNIYTILVLLQPSVVRKNRKNFVLCETAILRLTIVSSYLRTHQTYCSKMWEIK